MPASIPLRPNFDARRVRDLARRCCDAKQSPRLLSLAAVYDGMSRLEAARIGGMDRQTLRDWVRRFNDEGPDGLANRKAPGRARYRANRRPLRRVITLMFKHHPHGTRAHFR